MKEENIYLACGKGFEAVVRFIVKLITWPFKKRSMITIGLLVLLAAAVYYDPTGFFATWKAQLNHFFSQMNFSMSGLVNSVVILAILTGFEPVRKIVFPFLDELVDAALMWRGTEKAPKHKFTIGEGLLLLGFAVCTAGVANAILGLIGNMGTPLG